LVLGGSFDCGRGVTASEAKVLQKERIGSLDIQRSMLSRSYRSEWWDVPDEAVITEFRHFS
jgi:hypothetical protein